MSDKYTGVIKGFQIISQMKAQISLRDITANDIVTILYNLLLKYDIDRILEYVSTLDTHINTTEANVHDIVIATLGDEIVEELYDDWTDLGNEDTLENFEELLYATIFMAETDEELMSDSNYHVMSVVKFFRMLYLYHYGIVYSHPPFLDAIKSGELIEDEPYIVLNRVTYPITKLYPSENSNIYVPEAIVNMIDTYESDIDSEVVFIDYLHELVDQSTWSDAESPVKLDIILKDMYADILGIKPDNKEVATVDLIQDGEVDESQIPTDADVRYVDFDSGTWFIQPTIETITEPVYYLTLFNTLETTWLGYDEIPPEATPVTAEPSFCIFRHPDDPSNIYVRFSFLNRVNQFTIPVSTVNSRIAISYDRDNVTYQYFYNDQVVQASFARPTMVMFGQRLTVDQVDDFAYYLNQVTDDQLKYLIS